VDVLESGRSRPRPCSCCLRLDVKNLVLFAAVFARSVINPMFSLETWPFCMTSLAICLNLSLGMPPSMPSAAAASFRATTSSFDSSEESPLSPSAFHEILGFWATGACDRCGSVRSGTGPLNHILTQRRNPELFLFVLGRPAAMLVLRELGHMPHDCEREKRDDGYERCRVYCMAGGLPAGRERLLMTILGDDSFRQLYLF